MSKVEKLHIEYLFTKRMGLLLLSCSHFLHCLFGFAFFCSLLFLFSTCSFLLVWVFCFVSVNIFLQQSTCNSFLYIDLLCL